MNSFESSRVTLLRYRLKQNARQKALTWLSLTIFVLMAFPRFRLTIGSIPLYIIDILILLTAYYASHIEIESEHRLPLRSLVFVILVAAVVSELVAGVRMGTLLQPVYLMGRTLLAGSLFFSVPRIIRSKSELEMILKAGLLGALITAALMILTSLPQTRDLVLNNIFSLSFLEPASEGVLRHYNYRLGQAGRGRSLIGVSILSAAFLNTFWSLFFLLRTHERVSLKWRIALTVAVILIPVAVVVSYSRGAIVGLLLVIISAFFFNLDKVRRPIVIGVGLALLVFSWLGWDSEYFYFDRIEVTVQNAVDNPLEHQSLTDRLYSYTEPFQHVFENPHFLVFGQGFARENVRGHNLDAGGGAAVHAVFAAAYYGYGMLAALAYIFLLLGGIRMTLKYIRRSVNDFSIAFSGALLAGIMGFLSWFVLGHAAVSQPRGSMLLFLLFGLVAAQVNFVEAPESAAAKRKSLSLRNYRRKSVSTTYADGS